MIEPRNFDIWRADALISAESNTGNIVTVRCCLLLRGQRAFHVSHSDYPVNWGEPDVPCFFQVWQTTLKRRMSKETDGNAQSETDRALQVLWCQLQWKDDK